MVDTFQEENKITMRVPFKYIVITGPFQRKVQETALIHLSLDQAFSLKRCQCTKHVLTITANGSRKKGHPSSLMAVGTFSPNKSIFSS